MNRGRIGRVKLANVPGRSKRDGLAGQLGPIGSDRALVTANSGWAFTRNQPVGDIAPYPALQMPDGTLGCEHSNYRPHRDGWCQRIW